MALQALRQPRGKHRCGPRPIGGRIYAPQTQSLNCPGPGGRADSVDLNAAGLVTHNVRGETWFWISETPASSKNAATALWTRCFNHSNVLAHASTSRSFKCRPIDIRGPVLTLWTPLLTLARFCSCVSNPGGVAAPVCLYKSSLSAKNTSSYHSW